MIHSLSGGIIADYDNLIYVFVQTDSGKKMWFISPYPLVDVGSRVVVPGGTASEQGQVLRVENVTAQTAPWPVNRTKQIEALL